MLDFQGANDLINPQSAVDPLAALHMLITDPEAMIPHLAAAGIPPPDRSQLTQFANIAPPGMAVDPYARNTTQSTETMPPIPSLTTIPGVVKTPGQMPGGQGPLAKPIAQPPTDPSVYPDVSTFGGGPTASAPGFPASIAGIVNPGAAAPGGMTSLSPSSFGPLLPFGQSPEAVATPPSPEPAAPGAPLDITPKGVEDAAKEKTTAPGSKGAIDNAIRALQGVKMPPAPAVQKLDSPRVTAGHAISQNPPAVAALLQQLLGQTQGAQPLRLGQAVR